MGRSAHIWFWQQRGVWCCDIGGKRHSLGKDKKQALRQFHTLKAAAPAAPIVSAEVALSVLIDRFLGWVNANLATDTFEWYRSRLDAFNKAHPGLGVGELRKHHVTAWIDSYPHLSAGSKRNLCRSIQRCLKWCEEEELIERSPLTGLHKPPCGTRDLVISDDEYQAILGTVRGGFRDLFAFAWITGARAIELFTMSVRHVDLAQHRVVWPKAESKGRKLPRILYLNPEAEKILARLIGRRTQGYIFLNSDGAQWNADSVNCAWSRVEAKLRKKFCFTSIRHTWCHRMLKAGTDCLTVSVLMGHADTSMVARVYSHLTQAPDHLLSAVRGQHSA
jgi:integrase